MPRLIDVDVLRERMYHDAFETDSDMQKWDSGCWIRYKMFENALDEQPTVDAEPVRHGKWVHTKWSNMRHDYSCSLCGCRISGVDPFSLSATAYYYCPECGAKMDEVEDG